MKYLFVFSILIGLFVGYINSISWKYSASRIIVFFPYFILGYLYKNKENKINTVIKNKKIALAVFIIISIIIIVFSKEININYFFCAMSYSSLKLSGCYGLIYRVSLYVVQFLMLFSFFKLIPNKEKKITPMGRSTLYIYLLHGFVVKLLLSINYYKNFGIKKFISLIIIMLITVFICYEFYNIKYGITIMFKKLSNRS